MSQSAPVYVICGASRGLGLGQARVLLERLPEVQIVATARNPTSANLLQDLKSKYEERLHVVKMDVTSRASCETAAQEVSRKFADGVDALVVNAGIFGGGLSGLGPDNVRDLRDNMNTNVFGAMHCVEAFLPLVRQKEAGKKQIFLISSIMGSLAGPMGSTPYGMTYSMSKAALNMFGLKLSAELGEEGVTVVSIHPGYVQTEMNGGEGGPATLGVEESVTQTVDNIYLKATRDFNGAFLDWTGKTLPW